VGGYAAHASIVGSAIIRHHSESENQHRCTGVPDDRAANYHHWTAKPSSLRLHHWLSPMV